MATDSSTNNHLLEGKLSNEGEIKLSWKDIAKQVLCGCLIQSLVIQAGIGLSFSAILLPQLNLEESKIKITKHEASWIAGLVALNLPLGSIAAGPLMDKFGRRTISLIVTIPFAISSLLHVVASNIWFIYIARSLAGFTSGVTVVSLVYGAEMSHPKLRAMLLSLNSVMVSLGILITCILGTYLYWRTVMVIFTILALTTFVQLYIIPESPHWLYTFKGDEYGASKSLKWLYSNNKQCYEKEFERLTSNNQNKSTMDACNNQSFWTLLRTVYCKPGVYKPTVLLTIIFLLQQLSGSYVIIFYAVDIFTKAGGTLNSHTIDSYTCLMVLALIRLFMAIICAITSRKFGRRTLLCTSALGMALNALIVGIVSNGNIAQVCVLGYVTFSSFGMMVIPWSLIGELLPIQVKGKMGGVMIGCAYLFMFVMVKLYPYVIDAVDLNIIFYFLAGINLFTVAFIWIFLPETLAKTFKEIEEYFKK